MRRLMIGTESQYAAHIGQGLMNELGNLVRENVGGNKAFVISDCNVFALYGKKINTSLEKAGFIAPFYVFDAGERSKNLETYGSILQDMARSALTRSDVVIALGGGVTGDLAGFAAASYLRGIRYVQVPTTLLAAVDSSVGGKTAVNLSQGKNLAGAFHPPSLVVCDTDTLTTLDEDTFADGSA